MAVVLTKRANAGYTLVYDGVTVYPSELKYFGTDGGIILFAPGLKMPRFYPPADWTIGGVDGYTTVLQVADALDALGVVSSDTLDDMKALLTTIDADTGALVTSNAAILTKQGDGSQKTQVVDSAGVLTVPQYRVFSLTLTRPANQTVYAAGDVIGDVGAALDKFVNVAKAAGYGVVISNIRLQTNDTGLAGKVINLHFYSDTVDPIADNAAFALSDANAPKRRGMIQCTFGTGTLGRVAQAQFENLIVQPVGRDIPVILETVAGFTPSANSTWIRVEIGVIIGN